MKLIIGLGNPELQYTNTRHNIGFRIIDAFADKAGLTFAANKKLKSDVATYGVGSDKVILVKPNTYYNLAGEAAREVADFYKFNLEDILIVHDELALQFGTVRTRIGGSSGGNNGIKSINQQLGVETARIRVGIANDLSDIIDDANFVLGKFSQEEDAQLKILTEKAISLIDNFISGSFSASTHR